MEDNNNKNLILATVLSFLVVLVWYTVFAPTPPVPTTTDLVQPAPVTQTAEAPAPAVAPDPVATAPRVQIDTPRLKGSISLMGGRLDDLALKDYKVSLEPDSPIVTLLAPTGGTDLTAPKPYYAVYGWSAGQGLAADATPNANTLWSLESGTTLAPGQPIVLGWANGAGLTFQRQIEVDENYMFTVTDRVLNGTAAPVSLAPYGIVARHGRPPGTPTYVQHEGAVRVSDGTLEETTYKNITKLDVVAGEGQAEKFEVASSGWVGFTDKFWMTTLIPANGQPFTSVVKYAPQADLYQAEARLPAATVAPGASYEVKNQLFAGAKEYETIKAYERAGVGRFIESIDWGWFYFFTKPMFRLLHWLHGMIGNMGWAIIALTFVIKALVFPLARKSYISMARMKELQPEMEALKERSGDDKVAMQKGMMELYKKNKVNPASGCLPILVQIPIFYALFKVISNTIELRHAPWIGWIRDLSAPDPSSILNLFGLLPWDTPAVGSFFHIFSLGVLPILLGISMWFQQKLNPAPTDPMQQKIFAWMPWIFMFMLGSFASGLVLYWIANNTITFFQQYTIMSMHHKRPDIFGNIREGLKRKPVEAKPAPKAPVKAEPKAKK